MSSRYILADAVLRVAINTTAKIIICNKYFIHINREQN